MVIYGLILTFIGLIFYISNILLIRHYVNKEVPGLLDIDLNLPPPNSKHEYLWENTAGTGIVPKWVSIIGILSIPTVIIGVTLVIITILI